MHLFSTPDVSKKQPLSLCHIFAFMLALHLYSTLREKENIKATLALPCCQGSVYSSHGVLMRLFKDIHSMLFSIASKGEVTYVAEPRTQVRGSSREYLLWCSIAAEKQGNPLPPPVSPKEQRLAS